mmetsp:Transcript_53609/g.155835  ORF Transcript_53609/g.155835 Transcript_53609/m.155835 type:complete len:213 (-) Transcript_53609:626-1264(-)
MQITIVRNSPMSLSTRTRRTILMTRKIRRILKAVKPPALSALPRVAVIPNSNSCKPTSRASKRFQHLAAEKRKFQRYAKSRNPNSATKTTQNTYSNALNTPSCSLPRRWEPTSVCAPIRIAFKRMAAPTPASKKWCSTMRMATVSRTTSAATDFTVDVRPCVANSEGLGNGLPMEDRRRRCLPFGTPCASQVASSNMGFFGRLGEGEGVTEG